MKNKHLISPMDFSKEELNEIFELAEKIISNPKEFSHICDGKILATLFYEPSTRTRFSFEAAMMRLGGKILGFSEPNSSSSAKGETLADTIRMVSIYSDIIAMRHPKEGSAKVASMYSSVPVINAGDGGHQHPTQTLTDLLTIKSQKGKLEGHTIGLCGDLKNGRTVQSLIMAMSRYKDTKFILISPKELVIPEGIEKIEASAFTNCPSLLKIEIPKTVKSIGDSCFSDNTSSLEEILIKNKENSITGAPWGAAKGMKVVQWKK